MEADSEQEISWNRIMALVISITFVNLLIVIFIRVLLDAEDEINEYIIKGETRNTLIVFLGVFSMSFFFGCCCCFCCAGLVCNCVISFPGWTSRWYHQLMEKLMESHAPQRLHEEDIVLSTVDHHADRHPHLTDLRPFESSPNPFLIIQNEAIPDTGAVGVKRSRAYSIDVGLL